MANDSRLVGQVRSSGCGSGVSVAGGGGSVGSGLSVGKGVSVGAVVSSAMGASVAVGWAVPQAASNSRTTATESSTTKRFYPFILILLPLMRTLFQACVHL